MNILTPLNLYLITMLDSIVSVLQFVTTVSFGVLIVYTILELSSAAVDIDMNNKDSAKIQLKNWFNVAKKGFALCVLSAFLTALVPDTKQAYIIFGLPAAVDEMQNVAKSETSQLAIKSLNKMLKDYVGETLSIETKGD